MRLLIVAVGTRMPAWVEAGFADYARRMPRELPIELLEVKADPRNCGRSVEIMMNAEAQRIEAALPARCHRVILDEHGRDTDTLTLARRLEAWMGGGQDVALVVGGPTDSRPPSRPAPPRPCACPASPCRTRWCGRCWPKRSTAPGRCCASIPTTASRPGWRTARTRMAL